MCIELLGTRLNATNTSRPLPLDTRLRFAIRNNPLGVFISELFVFSRRRPDCGAIRMRNAQEDQYGKLAKTANSEGLSAD